MRQRYFLKFLQPTIFLGVVVNLWYSKFIVVSFERRIKEAVSSFSLPFPVILINLYIVSIALEII